MSNAITTTTLPPTDTTSTPATTSDVEGSPGFTIYALPAATATNPGQPVRYDCSSQSNEGQPIGANNAMVINATGCVENIWTSSTAANPPEFTISAAGGFGGLDLQIQIPYVCPFQNQPPTAADGDIFVFNATSCVSSSSTTESTSTISPPPSTAPTTTTDVPSTDLITSDGSISGTSPSQSQPSSTSATINSGASPGTVAGAAIGAAIGAALLAFLVAFWFFRRRKPRYAGAAGPAYLEDSSQQQLPGGLYLAQSADDRSIRSAVESLYSMIDQHVENYYGNTTHSAISNESQAALREVDGGFLPRSAEELLSDSATPIPVIKHCFAWMILSRLSPSADPRGSLLPAELARQPAEQAVSKNQNEREEKAVTRAYDHWRVLTAQLLYPSDRKAIPEAPGKLTVISTLITAFEPWSTVNPGSSSASEHLHSIMKTATATGLLVTSQASRFAFDWDVVAHEKAGSENTEVVTFPTFGKTADERGNMLGQMQILVKPKIELVL